MADLLRHERSRWEYMNRYELHRRLGKITKQNKLECFISQAEAVARRISPTQVVVTPYQAGALLLDAVNRATALGFTSLAATARTLFDRLPDLHPGTRGPSRPTSITISPEQLESQRLQTLIQQVPSLDFAGFIHLFRSRSDFSATELRELLNYFRQVLEDQYDNTYPISRADARNLCGQVQAASWNVQDRTAIDPIYLEASYLITQFTANQATPQPRPTHRIVRIRKKEK